MGIGRGDIDFYDLFVGGAVSGKYTTTIRQANADAKTVQIRYSGMHENTVSDVGDDVGTVGGKRSVSG